MSAQGILIWAQVVGIVVQIISPAAGVCCSPAEMLLMLLSINIHFVLLSKCDAVAFH